MGLSNRIDLGSGSAFEVWLRRGGLASSSGVSCGIRLGGCHIHEFRTTHDPGKGRPVTSRLRTLNTQVEIGQKWRMSENLFISLGRPIVLAAWSDIRDSKVAGWCTAAGSGPTTGESRDLVLSLHVGLWRLSQGDTERRS